MKRSKVLSSIPEDQAEKLFNDWRNCSPGELSNLFYNVTTNKEPGKRPVERIDAYKLGEGGIRDLKTVNFVLLERIRIYMGCSEGEFTPIFTIVLKDGNEAKYDYYKLEPILTTPVRSYPIISSGISDLLQRKWRELSNEELSTAFTGLTCSKIEKHAVHSHKYIGDFRNQRVRYYDFIIDDAQKIANLVKGLESPKVEVLLGAGLTVQITHPFNFRPIITVSSAVGGTSKADGDDDDESFERSQPCPPFCHNGIGSDCE